MLVDMILYYEVIPLSLKSVEMQIAVPRTNEAGKMHNETQQRPMNDQTSLAGELTKNSRAEAQRSTEVSETAETAVRDDGSRQSSGKNMAGERQNQAKQWSDRLSILIKAKISMFRSR